MARALTVGIVVAFLVLPAAAGPSPALGTVSIVDRVNDRVKVDGPGGWEAWFARSPRTAVTVFGEPAAFEDLRPGYRVAVTYQPGSADAVRIDALP